MTKCDKLTACNKVKCQYVPGLMKLIMIKANKVCFGRRCINHPRSCLIRNLALQTGKIIQNSVSFTSTCLDDRTIKLTEMVTEVTREDVQTQELHFSTILSAYNF